MAEPAAKRLKASPATTFPTSVVTWNCNGFISRCKYNAEEIDRLVKETQHPDCVCIQEVRLKASGNRGKPLPSEYEIVKKTLTSTFQEYTPYWSLSDKRYSGTVTLLHNRLQFSGTTAFTPQSAIDALLLHCKVTREQVGLPAKKKKIQPTMASFFAPKKQSSSSSSGFQEHNSDGRFQFFLFPDMDFIQTYVPNNGSKEESFERRRKWDQEILEFFNHRKQILQHVDRKTRRLLWCGDMNCAREYKDGTHWEEQQPHKTIYEWWTDESKCFVSSKQVAANRSPENVGMPSFTPGERRRFSDILTKADLLDIWRDMHPNGTTTSSQQKWDRPDFTWRGHLGLNGQKSKYEGRGQRLDYFLASPSSLFRDDSVDRCDILGYGGQREGLFCGSDHCASLLVLKKDGEASK